MEKEKLLRRGNVPVYLPSFCDTCCKMRELELQNERVHYNDGVIVTNCWASCIHTEACTEMMKNMERTGADNGN